MKKKKFLGYTLIEVLVAIVILGLVMPGLIGMVISSRSTQVANYRMVQAMSVGQLVLDSVSLRGDYNNLEEGSGVYTYANVDYKFEYTQTLRNGVRSLVVRVFWKQGDKQHGVVLQGAAG
jgi:prepilin-type N-terminal cleavage/methylation domain-containing protein